MSFFEKLSKKSFLLILFFFSLVGALYTSYQANHSISFKVLTDEVTSNLQDLIASVDEEAREVLPYLKAENEFPAVNTSFVVLRDDSIVAWSDNHFIPKTSTLTEEFDLKFHRATVGNFLLKKYSLDEEQSLIAIIPLNVQYKISNNYLIPYWNKALFSTVAIHVLEPTDTRGMAIAYKQQTLFKIEAPENSDSYVQSYWHTWTIIFGSIIIFILVLLLIFRIQELAIKYPALSFVILFLLMFLLRFGMIVAEFPGRFTDSPLFNPANFASSYLNPSLGDLVLNSVAVFILCYFLFRNYYRFQFFHSLRSNRISSFLLSVVSVTLVLFGILYSFVVTQTIYNNSTLTLSIAESIHFDLLRVFGLVSVLLTWICSFFFIHVFLRIFGYEKTPFRLVSTAVLGCILFIGINVSSGQHFTWSLLIGVVYVTCAILFSLHKSLQKFQYKTFAYFIVAVVSFSLNDMFAIRYFEQQSDFQNQLRFADNFLDERDYFGEYLLHEATQRISADVFIQTRMTSLFFGKETVSQKIKQIYLSGYFNRYAVDVFLYSVLGEPLTGSDTTAFSERIQRYDQEAYKTGYDGVYYIAPTRGDFSRKYVVVVPLMRGGVKAGHIVIELLLKRIIPQNVYPELLVDSRFHQNFNAQEFSYAVISGSKILYSAGDFNYDSFSQNKLRDVPLYTRGLIEGKYFHVAVEDDNERISIVSSRTPSLIFWLADFSFQVVLGMTFILILLFAQGVYTFLKSRKLYLAARIQLILNLAFFLPLVAVSIITINLTTQSSQEQLNSEFLNKANRFGEAVALGLQTHPDKNDFEREFRNLTSLANLDANVYQSNGSLMTTSQPLIFENELQSPYINALAYKRIKSGDKNFIATEQVGNLQFNVVYSALYLPETGNQIGILAVPFFQSASSLERMQIVVLANILSIFTLVFIVLLIVSFLAAKWLTAPLQVITKTLGHLSLTRTNKPLEWQSDDEIGMMAKEYNQMLINLNDSKQELERNQRERAWREIAQQVAHEIKNPLTPMKLTLQKLEKTLENSQDDKVSRAVDSLLSQVNTLNDIASSFSSFAKMPEPVMKEVELIGLISKTIDLHNEKSSISFNSPMEKAYVLGDEQLLGRIFSNIILNALQAGRDHAPVLVGVTVKIVASKYQIVFSDNGKGIDSALIDKIFLPHFTTKQSGSGLGLAISKQGIEQMGGKIWFETSGTGTTFTIELKAV